MIRSPPKALTTHVRYPLATSNLEKRSSCRRKRKRKTRNGAKKILEVAVGADNLLPEEWEVARWRLQDVKLPDDLHKKDPRYYTPEAQRQLKTKRQRLAPKTEDEDNITEVFVFLETFSARSALPNDRHRCRDRYGQDSLKLYLNFSWIESHALFEELKRRRGEQ